MILTGKTKTRADADKIAALSAEARRDRDIRIAAVQWRRDRHADEITLGLSPTEPLEPILAYIQALRDVPSQPGFPETIDWPTAP